MLFKKFKPFCSSSVYRFVDPDTQYEYEAGTYPELVQKIVKYRTANELDPIEQLSAVLDNYLCNLPENTGSCTAALLKRSFLGYLKGGIALIQNMTYDSIVTQEVADERGSICVKCPNNVFEAGGAFVHWSNRLAEASIGTRKSKYHEELGSCAACSCPLRCKVWYGGKIELTEAELAKTIPECWQRPEYGKAKTQV